MEEHHQDEVKTRNNQGLTSRDPSGSPKRKKNHAHEEYTGLQDRIKKVRSQVSLQQKEPFTISHEEMAIRKGAYKLLKCQEIERENKRVLKKIQQIIKDQKAEGLIEERVSNQEQIINASKQRTHIFRQTRQTEIESENRVSFILTIILFAQKLQQRILSQRSSLQNFKVSSSVNTSMKSTKVLLPPLKTKKKQIGISKEKDSVFGFYLERQAQKMLDTSRKVLMKKSFEIPVIKKSYNGQSESGFKFFMVEISTMEDTGSPNLMIAAFDLLSEESFLLRLSS